MLDGANLENTDLSDADLEFATWQREPSGAGFCRANLRRANLVGVTARGADFSGADLFYSRPGNGNFERAVFKNANVERAIFRRANLRNANLSGVEGAANYENAILEGIQR